MVWSDDTGRRIRLRVKRRTPEARAADEAIKGRRSQEPEEPTQGTPKEED